MIIYESESAKAGGALQHLSHVPIEDPHGVSHILWCMDALVVAGGNDMWGVTTLWQSDHSIDCSDAEWKTTAVGASEIMILPTWDASPVMSLSLCFEGGEGGGGGGGGGGGER